MPAVNARLSLILAAALMLAGCNRRQSALAPFGADARDVLTITTVLTAAAVVIAIGVAVLVFLAMRAPEGRLTHAGGMRLVFWLGGVIPSVLLAVLLLATLPAMRPRAVAPADLRIAVEGEQFWWRVRYRPAGAAALEASNEIRLPVGRTVELELTAADVIHSFWIPGLAGKMDMIPGRTNRLVVRAEKPGRYRGVCTEFCGLSHALMAFDVVAMEPAAFDAWLADQRRPGSAPAAFAEYGCGGCHTVRGTEHRGRIGPDLTHYGAHATVGAGTLPMTQANVGRFIRAAGSVKPGARMPAFPHIPPADLQAISAALVAAR